MMGSQQVQNIPILKQIEEEFRQARERGILVALFVDSEGVLNIGFPEQIEQHTLDRLVEHLRRKWKNISYEMFFDEMQGCHALKIREKRPHLMMGKAQVLPFDIERVELPPQKIFENEYFGDWLAVEEEKPKKKITKKKKGVKKNDNRITTNRARAGSKTTGRKNIRSKK